MRYPLALREAFRITGLLSAVFLVCAGCASAPSDQVPSKVQIPQGRQVVQISSARDTGNGLQLSMSSCNADPLIDVIEHNQEILIGATVAGTLDLTVGETCQDLVDVDLARSVGERAIRDMYSGLGIELTE